MVATSKVPACARTSADLRRPRFRLEHRTLTESPIDNAWPAKRLPAPTCTGQAIRAAGWSAKCSACRCADLAKILNAEQVHTLFAADRTLAPQLGLLPLSEAQMKARDAAYDADRKRLLELVAELDRQMRIGRFVRVACPARGTTLASGRLDRWLSVLDYVATAATGGGLSPAASTSCSPWSRSAPTRAPCPASRR
jgi:hypothetical protein